MELFAGQFRKFPGVVKVVKIVAVFRNAEAGTFLGPGRDKVFTGPFHGRIFGLSLKIFETVPDRFNRVAGYQGL